MTMASVVVMVVVGTCIVVMVVQVRRRLNKEADCRTVITTVDAGMILGGKERKEGRKERRKEGRKKGRKERGKEGGRRSLGK